MPAELITKIQDLKVGDIFLGPIGGWAGTAVGLGELIVDGGFHVGMVDVRHAGIVVTALPGTRYDVPGYPSGVTDTFEIAQAMPDGAEIATMTYAQHWTRECLYVRLPEDYPGQALDAAAVARAMVDAHVAYSPLSYAALAAWHWGIRTGRLEAWIDRRKPGQVTTSRGTMYDVLPVEAICSVFVDQAWSLAGKQVMPLDTPHQCVTPSKLGQALLATPGAVLGWPAFHLPR
jgi:hypothetical protein